MCSGHAQLLSTFSLSGIQSGGEAPTVRTGLLWVFFFLGQAEILFLFLFYFIFYVIFFSSFFAVLH